MSQADTAQTGFSYLHVHLATAAGVKYTDACIGGFDCAENCSQFLLYTSCPRFVKTFWETFSLRKGEKMMYNRINDVQIDNRKGEIYEIYFLECKRSEGLCTERI